MRVSYLAPAFAAGLALQYCADQVEAVRRAPPPPAPLLAGRPAAAALLAVLPAAQLLLMWRLFLEGFSTGAQPPMDLQLHHTSSAKATASPRPLLPTAAVRPASCL